MYSIHTGIVIERVVVGCMCVFAFFDTTSFSKVKLCAAELWSQAIRQLMPYQRFLTHHSSMASQSSFII